MSDDVKKAIELALMNRAAPPAAFEAMIKANEAASDWTATCQKCGEILKGTLEKIRGHNCA